MNSIHANCNSPPIKDENYAKTASLLKAIAAATSSSSSAAASSTSPRSPKPNASAAGDINANEQLIASGRGAYIPYAYDDHAVAPSRAGSGSASGFQPVELQVTNLDQNIEQREMKKTITNIFREHVPVIHVSVFFQSDGNMAACVRVPTPQDAQYAISQLHRKKIGFKRILISRNDQSQGHNPMFLRSKVMNLLSEVPSGKLQLFKFREMYEKRYHDSIGVSDLYKMKDVVMITEEQTGRMVQLHAFHRSNVASSLPSSNSGSLSSLAPTNSLFMDSTTCPIHSSDQNGQVKGWAEKENGPPLPNVIISLSLLGPNLKNLLKSHGGSMPLATLKTCYEAEFQAFVANNNDGVPLEHLVTCVPGISIQNSTTTGVKVLVMASLEVEDEIQSLTAQLRNSLTRFSGSTNSLNSLSTPAPPLASQLALFSRELVDLLKTSPGCRMPFHKFIPMYHHFFGRQCRVADYGYTKLKDLFEALPHVVQIIGEGSRAMITLSHRAQVKRFTSDLLKVLKGQPSKQIALYDLPTLFEKSNHKAFKISDYGVCEMEDMIGEVSETSVVITTENNDGTDDIMISIPKREQTNEELARTHKFAEECIELLKHVPECRLPFNKFIPAYHHHFGRQCRVADYGFTKLIELFEAIPTTIEITEDADGERILQLTDGERLNVVGEHIAFLIKNHSAYKERATPSIFLSDLPMLYLRQYGHALRPENFGEASLIGIIEKLHSTLRIDPHEEDHVIRLIDRSFIKILSNRIKEILTDIPDGKLPLKEFQESFKEIYNEEIQADQLKSDLKDLVQITKSEDNPEVDMIELVPLQLCGIRIQNLLKENGDKMPMSEFEAAFAEKYMTPLCPGQYGYPGLANLMMAFPENFTIRGRGTKKMIVFLREGRAKPSQGSLRSYPSFTSSSSGASSMSMMRSTYGCRGDSSKYYPAPSRNHQYMTGSSGYPGSSRSSSTSWMQSGSRSHQSRGQQQRQSSQMRFNQPPPNYGLGFGGSSGPGCGGGEFWAELAQFGIFPQSTSSSNTLGTSHSAARSFNHASASSGRSPYGSPVSSPSFFTGNPTSMLPTPHSPSPLLQSNRVAATHFAFPPIWPSSHSGSGSGSGYRGSRNES